MPKKDQAAHYIVQMGQPENRFFDEKEAKAHAKAQFEKASKIKFDVVHVYKLMGVYYRQTTIEEGVVSDREPKIGEMDPPVEDGVQDPPNILDNAARGGLRVGGLPRVPRRDRAIPEIREQGVEVDFGEDFVDVRPLVAPANAAAQPLPEVGQRDWRPRAAAWISYWNDPNIFDEPTRNPTEDDYDGWIEVMRDREETEDFIEQVIANERQRIQMNRPFGVDEQRRA